ncbi:2-hydroxyacid dehydrogenase [Castellaniella sp. GW247-6E4]|uniref:2-hydroxyacid dehydrogenase n=1 Tax=Castellaniella sp. GW247-6E4 TaxID=3140380 RepID=UPI003315AC19
MKIIMVGEAANHRDALAAGLPAECAFLALPREAAHSGEHDAAIAADDVLITLRFSRPRGEMPAFRLLHVPGAGLDGIALDTLPPSATVCNVFEHEIPIAEYVLLTMLDSEIRLAEMRRRFVTQNWSEAYRHRVQHGEIHGKTIGLIGMGRIARAIAQRAKAFGMRTIATDPQGGVLPGLIDDFAPPGELDRLLGQADFLVIACPLTEATRGMIGAGQLRRMKPSAVLINVSRAPIVEEGALFAALKDGTIGAAVLDVWYRYPSAADDEVAPADYPFHELPNVVCTPHSCAWTTNLAVRRYGFIAGNIRRLIAGEPLLNVVRAPSAGRP